MARFPARLTVALAALLAVMACLAREDGAPPDLATVQALLERGQYEPARAGLLALAAGGDPRAFFYLGVMYDRGQGVAADAAKAFHWYERAALAGHAEARFNLGNAFKHGRGTVASDELAVYWWRKAETQGQNNARFNLALQYYQGVGVEQDLDRAMVLIREAAAAGHPRAQALVASGAVPPAVDPAVEPGHAPAEASPAADPATETPAQPDGSAVRSAAWLARQEPGHFTLQLAVLNSLDNLDTFLKTHNLGQEVVVVARPHAGTTRYHILLGHFSDRQAAGQRLASLSPVLRTLKPWPRTFAELQHID